MMTHVGCFILIIVLMLSVGLEYIYSTKSACFLVLACVLRTSL
jgi:hypothetical protein